MAISSVVPRAESAAGNAAMLAPPPMSALLSVRDVVVRFRGIVALDGVSFDVFPGQIAGLIGPNGAGKTTMFNCLSGLYTPQSGDIHFGGQSILAVPRHARARLGMGRTFQNVALFNSLTVLDNVLLGGHSQSTGGFLGNALRLPSSRLAEKRLREEAAKLIEFMELNEYRGRLAGQLPFPILKRVELARALMIKPRLLLLDEPAAGLNHDEVEALKAQIRRLRDEYNLTVLLVEHHMNLVMSVSDKVIAMEFGRKIADGTPSQVQNDDRVIRAYLGGGP